MNNLKNISISRGFTLVEILIALVVFTVGIVGLVKVYTSAVSSHSYALRMAKAVEIQHNNVEWILALPSNHTSLDVGALGVKEYDRALPPKYRGITFTPHIIIKNVPGSKTVKQANIIVTWNDKGTERSINVKVIR